MEMIDHALAYAEKGFPVFPLHEVDKNGRCSCSEPDQCAEKKSQGKHPRSLQGFKDATTDPDKIAEFWDLWPTANIGIPTGKISGFNAVDIDPRNGGIETAKTFPDLPHTPAQRTGGGGWHYLLEYFPVKRFKLGSGGIDIKADGGYIVAAPSKTNDHYKWLEGRALGQIDLAPAPQWILSELTEITAKPDIALGDAGVITSGRNNYLLKQLGRMQQAGLTDAAIREAVHIENQTRCSPPLSEHELETTVFKALNRYEKGTDLLTEYVGVPLETSRQRVGLVSAKDWVGIPRPPIREVVQGLIYESTMTMLAGPAKGGKSVLAKQLSLCVARGIPFLGREVIQGPVIYLALEEPDFLVKANFESMGMTDSDDVRIMFGQPHKELAEDIAAIVRADKPVLLITDTITRVPRPKGNLKVADYMGNAEWLEWQLYLAHETGTVTMPIYHSSQAGRNLEGHDANFSIHGSVGISATYDQLITITVQPDDTRAYGSYGRFEPVPPTLLAFDRETQWLTQTGTRVDVQAAELELIIIDLITENGASMSRKDITNSKEYTEHKAGAQTKNNVLKGLVDKGVLKRTGNRNTGYDFSLFAVPALGTELRTTESQMEGEWESITI